MWGCMVPDMRRPTSLRMIPRLPGGGLLLPYLGDRSLEMRPYHGALLHDFQSCSYSGSFMMTIGQTAGILSLIQRGVYVKPRLHEIRGNHQCV